MTVAPSQRPDTETGTPPPEMPRPVPLDRDTRDPLGAQRMAAQQAADHERQLADSSVPRPGQQFEYASVQPAHIGLPFLPGAIQDPKQNSRTSEPGYGSTVTTELHGSIPLEDALAYYRRQIQEKLPGFQLEEQRHSPSYATLTANQGQTGTRVSVLLNVPPHGGLSISLSRWQAGALTVPATDDGADR